MNSLSSWESCLKAQGADQQQLLEQAGAERDRVFGNQVFVRAVIEISNFCRQNCTYCGMRRDHKELTRYRMTVDQLLEIILKNCPPMVTDINLQAGEDPVAVREIVIPLVREIRRQTSLGVSVCLGTLSEREYTALHEAGAEFYIIKIETGNREHFRQLQAPGSLETRMAAIQFLAAQGWFVSSGFIAGLPGQTLEHVTETLELLQSLPLDGVSVSPFIPGEGTPLANATKSDGQWALNTLAAMRIKSPERIIPAVSAFNLTSPGGYVAALRAGANLTTINLTPDLQRDNYLLYTRERIIMNETRVTKAMEEAACQPSTKGLIQTLNERRQSLAAVE